RLWVTVSGDKVTGYHLRYLHVPEWWQFEERRRQVLRVILLVSTVTLYIALLIALLVFGLRTVARKEPIAWRAVLPFPIIVFALTFAFALNYAPLWFALYDPAKPIGTFITQQVMFALFRALLSAIALLVFVLPIEPLSGDRPPAGIRLSVIVRPAFWCTREAVTAILVGFCLGMVHLGYVTAFYLLGRKVGVWTPLDIPYTDAVATPLPFLVPLFQGLTPALTEELFFRFAAIYLLWHWTKRFWVAVLVPNVVWAFSHVGYPPEPAFVRGLELTVVALVYTWVVFRYSIVASIVAHYTYNALLAAHLLLRAEEPSLRLSGIIAGVGMLWLLLPSVVSFLRHRKLLSAADLKPVMPTPVPQPTVVEVPYAPYQPINRKVWIAITALAFVSLAFHFFTYLRQPPFKVVAMTQINRNEAKQIAAEFLRRKGVNVEQYRTATRFVAEVNYDDADAAYILEHADRATLHRLWLEHLPFAFWQVRFFKPLEREEWFVSVRVDGRLIGHRHKVPEEAKGALLTKSEAQKRGETYLRELGINLSEWKLVEADSIERPNRRDWLFVYELKTFQVGEAKLRMRVAVQGDEAHDFAIWLQVPEEWRFEREQFEAWTDLALFWFLFLMLVSFIVTAIVDWREGAFGLNRRLGFKFALALAPLALLQMLNGITNWWMGYRTELPPPVFIAVMTMTNGIILLFVFMLLTAVGSFDPWMKVRLPEVPPLSVWLSRYRDEPSLSETPLCHHAAWRDAVLFGYIASIAFLGLFGGGEENSWLIRNSFLPAIDFFAWTVWVTVILLALGMTWAGTYRRYIRTPQRLLIVLLLLLPLGLVGTHSPTEAMKEIMEWAITLFIAAAILYWLGQKVLRHNLFAWALGIALPILLSVAVELLQAPNNAIKAHAIPLLVVYFLPALSLLRQMPSFSSKSSLDTPTT
ncbi:MAG: CPBP family intramembrane glutamic endopeptidase, partial [Armatimonadota bacterium]